MTTTTMITTPPAPSTSAMVTHSLPRKTNSSFRLLYRGALSLPDSEVSLEGITFVANLPCKSPGPLMSSPVPLALESMRGRSALRLVGVVETSDIRLDLNDEVSMYIHRDAFLTRTFFHRVLCQPHLPPFSSSTEQITKFSIRIGLNDGSGTDDSDLLIYGVPSSPPAAGSTGTDSTKMHLRVSRIAPPSLPLSPVKRAPRPDDPAPRPRQHPLAHLTVNNHSNAHRLGLKRKRSATGNTFSALASACEEAERQRKLGKAPSFPLGGGVSGVGLGISILGGRRMVDQDGFLIPGTPTKASKKARMSTGAGVVESGVKSKSVTGREKDKERVLDTSENVEEETKAEESEMETNNKTAIKKRALYTLTDRGIPKTHDKFRELYSWVTRGVGFGLRGTIARTKVDRGLIQRLVDTHVGMYVDGLGGNCVASAAQANTERNTESVVE